MGVNIQPEAAWLIQVTYETSGRQQTCTRFLREGNEIMFQTRDGKFLTFDAFGKTYHETKTWMELRLNNFFNAQCNVLKFREIVEEI